MKSHLFEEISRNSSKHLFERQVISSRIHRRMTVMVIQNGKDNTLEGTFKFFFLQHECKELCPIDTKGGKSSKGAAILLRLFAQWLLSFLQRVAHAVSFAYQ